MKKILVTDLIGTLIPPDIYFGNYLYGNGTFEESNREKIILDKMFLHSAIHLKDFLDKGNEVNIVTSIDGHMTPSFMVNEFILRFYRNLLGYQQAVHIYFQVKNIEDTIAKLKNNPNVSAISKQELVTIQGAAIKFLEEKRDVWDFLNPMLCQVYSIGDTWQDLEMMMKCVELGGRADFINYDFTHQEQGFEQILSSTLTREESLLTEKLALQRYQNFYQLPDDVKRRILKEISQEVLTNEHFYEERLNIYNKAFAGEIDINKLIRENYIHEIIKTNNQLAKLSFYNHSVITEYMCYKLGLYPTFTDYYTRVLK